MNISIPLVDAIAIDRFVSTSGRYLCFLAEAYKPVTGIAGSATLRWWEFVVCSDSGRVLKKVSLGGVKKEAFDEWERLREIFTAEFKGKEEPVDNWQIMTFANIKFTQEEVDMLKIKPIGARVFVRQIIPIDPVTKQWNESGLTLIQDEKRLPPATMGLVIRVGNDPMIEEMVRPGDVISYGRHDGSTFMENGQEYRDIGLHEIRGVRTPEDGYEDLNLEDPKNNTVVRDLQEIQAKVSRVSVQ